MESDRPPTRTDLQLLARVQFRDEGGDARECFGNIIELGPRSMRLEAPRPLETRSHLTIQVVFPGQRHYSRALVPLQCIVRKAHDEPNLHYDLEMTVLDKESHERLNLYLRRDPSGRTGSA